MKRAQIALITASLAASITVPGHLDARPRARKALKVAGIPLPPGSRKVPGGSVVAGPGFKKSVVFFERYLRRNNLPHKQVPTTSARGVLFSRFLSESKDSTWSAIQIYQVAGVTSIFIVPALEASPPDEKPSRP